MDGTTVTTGMEWATTAATSLFDFVETLFTTATSNTLFALLLAGGTLIPLGFKIFRKFKRM